MRSKRIAATVTFAAVIAAVALAHEPAKKPMVAKGTKTVWSPAEVKWAPMAALAGAKESVLWGDPKTGEHGIL